MDDLNITEITNLATTTTTIPYWGIVLAGFILASVWFFTRGNGKTKAFQKTLEKREKALEKTIVNAKKSLEDLLK